MKGPTIPESKKPDLKELLTRFFDEVWNQQRLDKYAQYVHEDFTTSGPEGPLTKGIDAARAFTADFLKAVPDYRIELLDLVAGTDRVAVRWICRGTHKGTLMGVAATGRRFSLSGISIYRFRGEKLAEVWRERDLPGMWRQLLPELRINDVGIPAPSTPR